MNEMSPDDLALKEADMREVGPWGQAAALSFRFLLIGAIGIAFFWLVSNIRQVPADSQAIVIRLGTVERVQGPGLLLALPRPIEQIVLVPASARQTQFTITRFVDGQDSTSLGVTLAATQGFALSETPSLNSGFLLTGDSNVVHLEAQIFYQISDPVDYMIQADHVKPALQRLFVASAVGTLVSRDLDSILVARPEIASQNTEAQRREQTACGPDECRQSASWRPWRSAALGLGITVSRVDLVPSIPNGAKVAFDNVLVVGQEADQSVAEARTNASLTMQQAQSVRDRTTTDATARAEEAVSAANVATASITALGQNTQDMSHGMQMSRLYYDRIGGIINKAGRVEIVGKSNGSVRLLLPATPTGGIASIGAFAMSLTHSAVHDPILLSAPEQKSLAWRLSLSLAAAGALILSAAMEAFVPTQRDVAELVAGIAAVLVGVPSRAGSLAAACAIPTFTALPIN